jgi:hypothetical protein
MNTTIAMNKMSQIMFDIDTDTYNEQKIKNKTYSTSDARYQILNYDKDILCDDDEINSVYRSIVIDPSEKNILCFSPPKSIPMDSFIEKYPELNDKILVNEIIEGTMMNLFYDKRIESWEIASRSAIGGNYWYFRNQYDNIRDSGSQEQFTFRDMFVDAFRLPVNTPLNSIPALQEFNKSYCYSFVLQHPENHLVFRIDHPRLILVSMFLIAHTHTENTYHVQLIPQYDFTNIVPELPMYSGMVNAPDNIFCNEIQSTSALVHLEYGNKKGVVITNTRTGERTKLDNPEYLKRKELRGNHPHLHYQYLALVHMGKVHEFLHYFPMYSHMFRQFYTQYQTFITDVHQAYVSYYIHRNTDTQLPKRHFIHAARIHHSIYIPSLSTAQKTVIKRKVVQEYFSKMDPREILFSMYYQTLSN